MSEYVYKWNIMCYNLNTEKREKGSDSMNVPVVLPTYNPKEKILSVVDGLISAGFGKIIIIDDGSRPECAPIFSRLSDIPGCTVLHHDVNRGKGRGLKTGFSYVLENFPDCSGVVTTDDDGQHNPQDIRRCAEEMERTGRPVLGARDFSGADIPPKSRFGNNATRFVFRSLCGIRITDTQTGLRALPLECLPALVKLGGERFEYETNMLLEMKRLGWSFDEVKIQTIYDDNNKGTHFNPLTDSLRIYGMIFKFMLSSLSCSLIDIGLFTLINLLTQPLFGKNETLRIFSATAAARVISSLVNFLVNRSRVFRSGGSVKRSIARYYILCAAQLAASALCVRGVSFLFGASAGWQSVIKMVIDTILFFVSFGIQRDWVYAAPKGDKK